MGSRAESQTYAVEGAMVMRSRLPRNVYLSLIVPLPLD